MARPELADEAPRDDFDALFEIDPDLEEVFNSNSAGNNTREPDRDDNGSTRRSEAQAIDEEIKITKKRQPVAKLNDTRLLADPGIPKLQRISKTRLKFRGKGHEFSDVAQLLRTYQLWLDDLYPRAKFADGLAMIEKLGHSRRMQITRRTWIDESKPKGSIEDDDAEHEPLPATSNPGSQPSATGVKHQEHISAEASLRPSRGIDERDTISQQRTNGAGPSAGSSVVDRGAPDDDELDALLAEEPDLSRTAQNGKLNEITPSQGSHRPNSRTEQSFEDDEEMLREFDMW